MSRSHSHLDADADAGADGGAASTEEIWEARYRAQQVFSGRPNAALVRESAGLRPGAALDLGCGEGGDAVWLAEQGWRVTAVDVSPTALRRGAERAEAAGVADRVTWEQHDLARSFPAGSFDLVSTCFLYPPSNDERVRILRRAAQAVVPGGLLLIVSHAGFPPWETDPDPGVHFPTPEEMLASLDLPAGEWDVLVSETYDRPVTAPDGRPASRRDSTLKLRRRLPRR